MVKKLCNKCNAGEVGRFDPLDRRSRWKHKKRWNCELSPMKMGKPKLYATATEAMHKKLVQNRTWKKKQKSQKNDSKSSYEKINSPVSGMKIVSHDENSVPLKKKKGYT